MLTFLFCGNPISNVIPETINKFTLQKNASAFQVVVNKKSTNSLSIITKPANCTFITRDRKFNLI